MKIGTSTVTAIYLGTTSIVSAYLGSTQVFGGASVFTPLDLFSTGAQGIWLDPSDLTTMFSDRAGTTPVTAPGTVVGLRLDKSKGLVLGPELFLGLVSGSWTAQVGTTITSNLSYSTSGTSGPIKTGLLTVGKTYLVSYDISATNSAAVRFQNQDAAGSGTIIVQTATGGSSGTFYISATAGGLYLRSSIAGTSDITINSLSVRELAGNHAVAPTDAARPTYGVEPKGGRRNLLTYSEGFDNAIYTKNNLLAFGSGSTVNATVAPDGTTTADLITPATATALTGVDQYYNNTASAAHTLSVYVKANGANFVQLLWNVSLSSNFANFDITAGTAGAVTAGTYTDATITPQGNDWFRCSITSTLAVANQRAYISVIPATNSARAAAYTGNGTSGVYLWGAQLELGSTATNYQRVTTAYDITESGVATCHYVQYDGSDDSMSTSAIDFTATDKMSVFAGVRKLSDAAAAILIELSANSGTNNSCFAMTAPPSASAGYGFSSRGTTRRAAEVTTGYAAPISNVLTGLGDISGDLVTLRVDGTQVAQVTTDQGTGNYGNYSLFFGRRNNATLPFNGKDYGLIVVGKAASAGEITDTETWLAAKTSGVSI